MQTALDQPVTIDIATDPKNPFYLRLLERFYNELMIPMFPMEDELDDLEDWHIALDTEWSFSSSVKFHVVLALDAQDETPDIMAGIVFSYYVHSKCGLIGYLVVSPRHQRKGLGRFLMTKAISMLEEDARRTTGSNDSRRSRATSTDLSLLGEINSRKTTTSSSPLKEIFLEANSPELVSKEEDTFPPNERIQVFSRLGFKKVDMKFVQPPLADHKKPCYNLWLMAYRPPCPSSSSSSSSSSGSCASGSTHSSKVHCLSSDGPQFGPSESIEVSTLSLFLHDYWERFGYSSLDEKSALKDDEPDEADLSFDEMMKQLVGKKWLRLLKV
jgi:GNAT superfamily N-acetyltransferase